VQGVGEGTLGAVGVDAVSQLGGESGDRVSVMPGKRSVGSSSGCSRNDTWNESKMRPDSRSQSRYAFEWGEYPIRTQGRNRAYVFGIDVGMKAKARQPISCRWDREGLRLYHSSKGVRPCREDDGVRFVR